MKTPRWTLNLAIVLINLLRPVTAFLIFREFFYFRIVNIACLYISYLILDSVEGILVFGRREIWTTPKKIFHHANNTVFTFTVISGVMLHLPTFYLFELLGFNAENLYTVKTWLILSLIAFVIIAVLNYSTRMAWGNIQQLLIRLSFLLYCFYYMWPRRGALISLFLFAAACLIGIEIKKYGWSIKELRKKDVRFRRKKQPPPII